MAQSTAPSTLSQYIADGLPKQDNETLRGTQDDIDQLIADRERRRQARDTVNAAHFQGIWTNYYSYTIGNTMTGARPRLIHKVGGDLGLSGFLVEATRHGTSLSDRTE